MRVSSFLLLALCSAALVLLPLLPCVSAQIVHAPLSELSRARLDRSVEGRTAAISSELVRRRRIAAQRGPAQILPAPAHVLQSPDGTQEIYTPDRQHSIRRPKRVREALKARREQAERRREADQQPPQQHLQRDDAEAAEPQGRLGDAPDASLNDLDVAPDSSTRLRQSSDWPSAPTRPRHARAADAADQRHRQRQQQRDSAPSADSADSTRIFNSNSFSAESLAALRAVDGDDSPRERGYLETVVDVLGPPRAAAAAASASKANAEGTALVVLLPLLGLCAAFVIYSCTLRRQQHAAATDDRQASQAGESINSKRFSRGGASKHVAFKGDTVPELQSEVNAKRAPAAAADAADQSKRAAASRAEAEGWAESDGDDL